MVPGDQFGDSRSAGVGFRGQKSIKVSFFILKSDVSYDFSRRQPSAPHMQLPLYGLGHVSAAADGVGDRRDQVAVLVP